MLRKFIWIISIPLALIVLLQSCGTSPQSQSPKSVPNSQELISPSTASNAPSPVQSIRTTSTRNIHGKIMFVSQFGSYSGNDPGNRSGRHCQISLLNPDGSNLETLLETIYEIRAPSCSPNGKLVTYAEVRDYYNEICFVNSDGSEQFPSGAHLTSIQNITWSPIGNQIAYMGASWIGVPTKYQCYLLNSDGSNPIRFTENDDIYISSPPAWSPDGKKIAICIGPGAGDPMPAKPTLIMVINTDYSNIINLAGNQRFCISPSWSLDGTKIVFCGIRRDWFPPGNKVDGFGLVSVNADGSNPILLTGGINSDNLPVWSPDGTKIAFIRWNSQLNTPSLYVINSDGSNLIKVGDNIISSFQVFSWSGDSKQLAYISKQGNNYYPQIYVVNANGSNQTRLTDTFSQKYFISWSK
jgi:Tol biopolymer transport system component